MHSWFASSSNTLPIVPESNVAPINVIVQPTLIENIIPDDPTNESTNPSVDESTNPTSNERTNPPTDESTNQPAPPTQYILEFHPSQIFGDPADRIPIEDYAPEIRSEVRRAYLLKQRNKAIRHKFEVGLDGKIWRSFQPQWLDKFDWLEYSVKKEAAFCFPCFLFKNPSQAARFGNDVFTLDGYKRWKTAFGNFKKHVDGPSSYQTIVMGLLDDSFRFFLCFGFFPVFLSFSIKKPKKIA